MAIPEYLDQRRYSYRISPNLPPASADYEVLSPESEFEQDVYDLFLAGQEHLGHEEYGLALDAFEELQRLILNTAHPEMPVDPYAPVFNVPYDTALVDILAAQAGTMLQATSPRDYAFPASLVADASLLPAQLQQRLEPAVNSGLVVTSFHEDVLTRLDNAASAALAEDWATALGHYETALKSVPPEETLIHGALLYDVAVLADKAGDHARAVTAGTDGLRLLERAGDVGAQVRALDTMTGVYRRGGQPELAARTAEQAGKLRDANNLDPIVVEPMGRARTKAAPRLPSIAVPAAGGAGEATLMAGSIVAADEPVKSYVVQNTAEHVEFRLNASGTKPLLDAIKVSTDLGLVTGYTTSRVQLVAYLPHMYFFVIPMAIGDALAGLGNLAEAERTYLGVLPYPYINRTYEAVELWTKLAGVYAAQGDAAYRAARAKVSAFRRAKRHYERIVRTDGTIDPASPLYADASFTDVEARIAAVLAAPDPAATGEDPELVTRVLDAKAKLAQIAAGLDFFGLAPGYLAPFGWEYLQTTARYFAQSASQIEQRYILFKSTAENEELQHAQLEQQADVAAQAAELERRGLAEAEAGLEVALANLDAAEQQVLEAREAEETFDATRWSLLLIAQAEAWTTYAKDDNVATLVALVTTRTLLAQDLEEQRLEAAVDLAEAAKEVAEEMVDQAEARVAVANQRVAIAGLQQTYAEENRDYLDMREFGSRLWFDLAAQAKALTRRYLDQAIEIAMLLERAYNAETERGVHLIRYDYSDAGVGDLLGADRLLADIDAFTADYVTTVTSKKLPVKKVISLADGHPTAFQRLRTRGSCRFPTSFDEFDREHPGLHLCKIRNVELVLLGITSSASVAGSLRNVGVSRFRRADGSIVARSYPADVMPLSQYSVRGDALLFRFNPNELKAFELHGIDTMWRLDLPPGSNRFDIGDILDAQLILYYDGYFSPGLEATVKAALPASGASARTVSMAMELPDELFYLKSNGDAEVAFTNAMFPANQTNRVRTQVVLKAAGPAAVAGGLTLRLSSDEHGAELVLVTDPTGLVPDIAALHGERLLDRWTLRITAADNPHLVRGGRLDLGDLRDLLIFVEFTFDYR